MFLKRFKEKSNQKFIEKALLNRKVSQQNKRMSSVGVLINHSEFSNPEAFTNFLNDCGVVTAKQKILTYLKPNDLETNSWDNTFTSKDFGWRGKLKTLPLQDFTKTKFDVLICYFLGDDTELKQIAAMSQAELKVGISNKDERLYDLIIDVSVADFEIFKTELKKYLTILNKI